MKQFLAAHVLNAVAQMERVEVLISERKETENYDGRAEVPSGVRIHIAKSCQAFSKGAEAMGATISAKLGEQTAKRLRKRKKPVNFDHLATLTDQLKNVFHLEMRETHFYCLPSESAAYYNPAEPLFGPQVDVRIGRASDDISESGKCFAVGRYTASVFHLMRAMEAAVQKISEVLGIADVEREWGKLLSDIHGKIELMPKGDERNEWSQVHANLYHVKQAWRNDTMHPKATYTEEEAREVFDAMRSFMRHLASLLPVDLSELIGSET